MTSSYVFSVSVSVAVAVSGSVDWQCTVIASSGIPPSLTLSPFLSASSCVSSPVANDGKTKTDAVPRQTRQ